MRTQMHPADLSEHTSSQESVLPYLNMGTGFLIGLSVGYVLKKSFKLLLFLIGVGLIALFILESQGIIQLDEGHLQESLSHSVNTFKHFVLFLKERLDRFAVSSGLSAAAGFLVGLKIG